MDRCVISSGAIVEEGAIVENAVLMDNSVISKGARVYDAIVGPDTLVEENEVVNDARDGIVLVSNTKAAKR